MTSIRKAVRGGFSTAELLVVIGIIGALTSLGIASFRNATGAARLRTSGTLCSNVLESARNLAISNKRPVAVAFIPQKPNGDAPPSLAILELNPTTQKWTQSSKLESLSQNIVIDPEFEPALNSFLPENAPNISPTPPPIRSGTISYNAREDYGYLVFLPSGGLYQNRSSPGMLRLREGLVVNGSVVNTSASMNYYDLYINPHTGNVKSVQP